MTYRQSGSMTPNRSNGQVGRTESGIMRSRVYEL